MSLTRAQWIEMWSSAKIIETSLKQIKQFDSQLSPYKYQKLQRLVKTSMFNVADIKRQIESVIGQME